METIKNIFGDLITVALIMILIFFRFYRYLDFHKKNDENKTDSKLSWPPSKGATFIIVALIFIIAVAFSLPAKKTTPSITIGDAYSKVESMNDRPVAQSISPSQTSINQLTSEEIEAEKIIGSKPINNQTDNSVDIVRNEIGTFTGNNRILKFTEWGNVNLLKIDSDIQYWAVRVKYILKDKKNNEYQKDHIFLIKNGRIADKIEAKQ